MTSKIFKSIFSVAIAVLISVLVIIISVLYPYFANIQEKQLKDELSFAASATEYLGEDYLRSLDATHYRLTWIDDNGTVLYDSHADAKSMENHANREEIKEAYSFGFGSSIRHSTTLTEQTIYEAKRLQNNTVLRISVSRATAFALILGMLQPIMIVLLLSIALSAFLAHRMANRVVEPLNHLDLEHPMENEAYEELSPLLHRIHAQHQEITRQMNILKHKQHEFNQITNNMQEALVLLDHNNRILSINPSAKVLFGSDGSCIGKDFLTIDRKQNMRTALEKAKLQGHADFRDVKNEKHFQFDLSRIDSEHNSRGIVILAFDITNQINAEKHRREFTANVSHELKTPLQSIIGSSELMENGIVKEEDIPRFVGHIRKEASRLIALIEDIIRLSQLDEGTEMPKEEVSLKALSEEVCETLSDSAMLKNITLEISGDEGIFHGVRRLLYEVIYNLCDNGIKYNISGGKVDISIIESAKTVCLKVHDTGIGIPLEHQDKIFERFYRVDKSHSKQSGGTGLGLSIVKHAVQLHHGKITVESESGCGTTISIQFNK